jgi:S-adenosyl-L-methionine hydrolase (adenosine-forming)
VTSGAVTSGAVTPGAVTPDRRGAVFLLTDYGYQDEFAGVTRAVVLREAPGAPVIDLTHGVPPFDVRAGALTLSRCVVHLGPGVVIAVVDPGVGSGRRSVAVAVRGNPALTTAGPRGPAGPRYLVGPDNGLLGWAVDALGGAEAVVALPPAGPDAGTDAGPGGGTFDGRDLFAPVAARLWAGATVNDVGMPVDPSGLVRLAPPRVVVSSPESVSRSGSVEAEVLWIDRFGNVQLAATAGEMAGAGLEGDLEIRIGAARTAARSVRSFAALADDDVGLLVDANGQIAVVCHRRSAATVLGVGPGDMVTISRVPG